MQRRYTLIIGIVCCSIFVFLCYYSFDYGPAHITVVDQYVSFAPGSAQYIWLENDLAASQKLWKFVILHEPAWSAAGGHCYPQWRQYDREL